ncbi:carboxypeptidase regulatory-like domain-containing protein [Thermodesulfobacteriota bacterium]
MKSFAAAIRNNCLFVCVLVLLLCPAGADCQETQGFISGQALTLAGENVAGLCIDIYSGQCWDTWIAGSETDAEGRYLLAAPPGSYYVYADVSCAADPALSEQWWTSRGGSAECRDAEAVTVTDSQTVSGINFALEQSAVISGRVTAADGTPLSGVCVDAATDPCGENWQAGTQTDRDGYFSIAVPAGTYYLRTYVDCDETGAAGTYIDQHWTSAGAAGDCRESEAVTVGDSRTVSGIDFTLEQGAFISGRVTAADGTPLPGVCVDASRGLCGEDWQNTATTDTDGSFSIIVPPGSYYLTTYVDCDETGAASAYIDRHWTATGGADDCLEAEATRVATGQTVWGIDFALEQGSFITGRVTTADGTPLPGVCVDATGGLCGDKWQSGADTDADGSFSIIVPPGTYYLRTYVDCDETGASSTYVDAHWTSAGGTSDCSAAEAVTVAAGQTVSGISFSLGQGSVITGRVTASDGTPLPGVCVDASQGLCGESWQGGTSTGADGTFSLVVPPGSYYLTTYVDCDETGAAGTYIDRHWTATGGAGDCRDAEAVSVGQGQTVPGIDFSLSQGSVISGRVTASDGTPLQNVCVDAFSGLCWENWQGGANTDREGYFSIKVPAGTYYIGTYTGCDESGTAGTHIDAHWTSAGGTGDCSEAEAVRVGDGQTVANIDFTLGQGSVIAGRVTASDGTPLPGVCVDVSGGPCWENWQNGTSTDAGGYYSITVPAGSYYVATSVGCDETGAGSTYVDAHWTSAGGTSECFEAGAVRVGDGQTVSNIDFTLSQGSVITGRVTTSDGTPLPGVCVDAFGGQCWDNWKAGGTTATDGSYEIVVPPGSYHLLTYVQCDDTTGAVKNYSDEFWTSTGGSQNCEKSEPVTLQQGQTVSGIDFALDQGAVITGRVTTEDGRPAAQVCIEAFGSPCWEDWWSGAQTDSSGEYTLIVPQGSYYVIADVGCAESGALDTAISQWWAGGSGTSDCAEAAPLSVKTGQTAAQADFVLPAGGVISGTVTSGRGTALADICILAEDRQCGGTLYGIGFTDAQGAYSITVPRGSYYIFTAADCSDDTSRQALIDAWWTQAGGSAICSNADPVAVSTGATVAAVDFSLSQGGMLTGRVTTDNGTPLINVCINADSSFCWGFTYGGAETDENGIFSLPVPAGSYYLSTDVYCADDNDLRNYADKTWNSSGGAAECDAAEQVTVSAGTATTGLHFELAYDNTILTAGFEADILSGTAPLTVSFTDRSTGDIDAWIWDFGDGGFSSEQNPQHTYRAPGTYTVGLTVDGPEGRNDDIQNDLIVVAAQAGGDTAALNGTVSGDVTAGVSIYILGAEERLAASGPEGLYTVAGLPPGEYSVVPIKGRTVFSPQIQQVVLAAGDNQTIDFSSSLTGLLISDGVAEPAQALDDGSTRVALTASVEEFGGARIDTVTIDLSSIGGSNSLLMYDDGNSGDETEGDGIYSAATTVAPGTPPGLKGLVVRAEDTAGRPAEAIIELEVINRITGSVPGSGSARETLENKLPGQKLTLRFALDPQSGLRSAAACSALLNIFKPDGTSYRQSIPLSTTESQLVINGATAGSWLYEIQNACTSSQSYRISTTTSGTAVVFGVVVDAASGSELDGIIMRSTAGISTATADGYYLLLHPSGQYTLTAQPLAHQPASRSLSLIAGGSTAVDLALLPTGSDNQSGIVDCPLEDNATIDAGALSLLRAFRDRRLKHTAAGADLVRRYYRHGREAARLLRHHPALRHSVRSCVLALLPHIAAALDNRPIRLSSDQQALIRSCLTGIAAKASAELKQTISSLTRKLDHGTLLNGL